MKIHQIGGVSYDSNIYVVMAQKPMVIDCGTGMHHDNVIRKLKNVINPDKIETIVLSHRHYDHTGGAKSLSEALNAELVIHENAAEAMRQGDDITTAASAFGRSFPKHEVREIKEGDVIDCGDVKLEVLHIPGHSNCSIALYDFVTKTLFSGDTVYTDGGIGRWDLPTGDYQEIVASLERLAKMEVTDLFPGHGPSSEGEGKRHILLGLKYAKMWG